MTLGPLMLDVEGLELTAEDRERLLRPQVGGVILFARNHRDREQLAGLVASIHALRSPALLVAVDQEGGRVQRFREGFTVLPPVRALGRLYDRDAALALDTAHRFGWLLATELRACGIDFSFAPVLDVDHGISAVIGDRALHTSPSAIARLAAALVRGMREAGMAAVLKHFPGHGGARADSHFELAVDRREWNALEQDLLPFQRLIDAGALAVMTAHVQYPAVDSRPAGFSSVWIEQQLRRRMGFQGAVFSDDLSMEGAAGAGGPGERAQAALSAGSDMLLLCNDARSADAALDALDGYEDPAAQLRLVRLRGRGTVPADVSVSPPWREARAALDRLTAAPELELKG